MFVRLKRPPSQQTQHRAPRRLSCNNSLFDHNFQSRACANVARSCHQSGRKSPTSAPIKTQGGAHQRHGFTRAKRVLAVLLTKNNTRAPLSLFSNKQSSHFSVFSRSFRTTRPLCQMDLKQVIQALEKIAPLSLAESWDNVGLLVSPSQSKIVKKIMLTNDLTLDVMDEAVNQNTDLIVSYHPPIFSGLKQFNPVTKPKDLIVTRCFENKIAIFSPHTSLDALHGGVNDFLASTFPSENVKTIEPIFPAKTPRVTGKKLAVHCPKEGLEKLKRALWDAGAGVIGDYQECSWESEGMGHFKPTQGANPKLGNVNEVTYFPEAKVEFYCPPDKVSQIVKAMYLNHPFEEPAFDLISLENSYDEKPNVAKPLNLTGQGRFLVFNEPMKFSDVITHVKKHLKMDTLKIGLARGQKNENSPDYLIRSVALCAGSGVSVVTKTRIKPDLYLTGEMSHHEVLNSCENGISVLLTNHSNSERGFLPAYRDMILKHVTGVEIHISQTDRDPLHFG